MSDPRETLARIRAKADAATEGPWEHDPPPGPGEDPMRPICVYPKEDGGTLAYVQPLEADAAFIAAARTTVPALVNALEAVLKLHVRAECPTCGSRDGEGNDFHKCDDDAYCEECDLEGYPCPTVEAITAVLNGETRD